MHLVLVLTTPRYVSRGQGHTMAGTGNGNGVALRRQSDHTHRREWHSTEDILREGKKHSRAVGGKVASSLLSPTSVSLKYNLVEPQCHTLYRVELALALQASTS